MRSNLETKILNVFEIPISNVDLETGFFQNLVAFHDTLTFAFTEWYNVYEVSELVGTNLSEDGLENYSKVFYNSVYGLIAMQQKNMTFWELQQ